MKKESFVYTLIILLGFISFSSFSQIDSSLAPYCYMNPGLSVNSKWAEMNPQVNNNDSKLFFVREDHKKNRHFQEIWCSEKDVNDQWQPAYKLPAPLNRGLTNSVVYVSPDGKDLLVKGFYKKGKYKTRGFSIAHYNKDNRWSVPEGIKIEGYKDLDNGIYNNACMSPDESVIIFSFCERKGETENNLYISFKKENNTFSKPQKFKEPINVEGSFDFSPFISDDGNYLFFSSDRAGGLGGNDIYKCKRLDDTWLNWSTPENMGPKVNTSGRDSYFSMDAAGNMGYMVTDINSIGKSDIVVVKLKEHIPQSLFGQVIDSVLNKKVPAKIKIYNPEKMQDTLVCTDSSGAYEVKLTSFGHYLCDVNAVGYAQKVDSFFIAKNNKTIEKTTITHYLNGVKLKQVNIQAKDKKPLKVKIKGTEMKESSGETDREGKLTLNLKEGNMYNVEINKIGFETYQKSFTVPVSKNKTDSSFTFIVELKALKPVLDNIYFDNNKSTTNLFPEKTVSNIILYLAENANSKLEISGHTDDVGSEAYNLELSRKRAHFVATYLANKGVEKTKMVTKGYGESRPLFKDTSAASRAKNRRIEFLFVE